MSPCQVTCTQCSLICDYHSSAYPGKGSQKEKREYRQPPLSTLNWFPKNWTLNRTALSKTSFPIRIKVNRYNLLPGHPATVTWAPGSKGPAWLVLCHYYLLRPGLWRECCWSPPCQAVGKGGGHGHSCGHSRWWERDMASGAPPACVILWVIVLPHLAQVPGR